MRAYAKGQGAWGDGLWRYSCLLSRLLSLVRSHVPANRVTLSRPHRTVLDRELVHGGMTVQRGPQPINMGGGFGPSFSVLLTRTRDRLTVKEVLCNWIG